MQPTPYREPNEHRTTRQRAGVFKGGRAAQERAAHGVTTTGRQEDTAAHTWRLCLMAMTFERELAPLDMTRILEFCVLHDLGEAIHGD
ncbi:HD domain-containing protein [Kushneria sinocarnis]|uniref:HD domain-containing protein n=1 Tax=Kushneria sinocarnis TaxID=595502 RepID=UPI001FE5B5D3|nr:HD domain-containing protein [Kushneria sinocarnis]